MPALATPRSGPWKCFSASTTRFGFEARSFSMWSGHSVSIALAPYPESLSGASIPHVARLRPSPGPAARGPAQSGWSHSASKSYRWLLDLRLRLRLEHERRSASRHWRCPCRRPPGPESAERTARHGAASRGGHRGRSSTERELAPLDLPSPRRGDADCGPEDGGASLRWMPRSSFLPGGRAPEDQALERPRRDAPDPQGDCRRAPLREGLRNPSRRPRELRVLSATRRFRDSRRGPQLAPRRCRIPSRLASSFEAPPACSAGSRSGLPSGPPTGSRG